MSEQYYSRVYTDRPYYADFDAPDKFEALMGIISTRLLEHPKAICSYSGGADSDILIDLSEWQKKGIPLDVADEYQNAEDKAAKRQELRERYPKCESLINFLCCCNAAGEPRPNIQLVINSSKHMLDFIKECPPDFQISAKCCDYCKKQPAHAVQKDYEMIITGERRDEGGMRSVPRSGEANSHMCFTETSSGQYRLRPLFYVSDKDKAWYKEHYGIRYSDAYEVYGLTRTGCCGCPISYKAVDDLEKIRPFEPNVVKAAWNIFGKSYLYRQKYNKYKAERSECKIVAEPDNYSLFDDDYWNDLITLNLWEEDNG